MLGRLGINSIRSLCMQIALPSSVRCRKGVWGNCASPLPLPKAQPRLPGEAPSCRKPLHQMAALSVSAKGKKMLPTGVKTQRVEQGGWQRCPGCQGIPASHGGAHPKQPGSTRVPELHLDLVSSGHVVTLAPPCPTPAVAGVLPVLF